MQEQPAAEWEPRAQPILADPIAAYDELRRRCPVGHSEALQWSLWRHADVMRALHDPQTFSNQVSSYPSVPNGMDPPAHTVFRKLIEPYFGPGPLSEFEPKCRSIAQEMVQCLPQAAQVEWMSQFAHETVVRMLCAFMGWPEQLHEPLREWNRKNQAATRAGDRAATGAVAFEFDGHIRAQLAIRRAAAAPAGNDVTSRLMRESVGGRHLTDEEIVSIVRNWTVGEMSTMAASIGILVQYLAERAELQQRLRSEPPLLPAAIDEILRIHPPLIANRRMVRRDTAVGGQALSPGDRVTLMWVSANRDESVFGDPDEFRLDRDPALNLLYGAGIHVCPGAPLARMELRVALHAVLAGTRRIALVPGAPAVPAQYPVSGFSMLPLRIDRG